MQNIMRGPLERGLISEKYKGLIWGVRVPDRTAAKTRKARDVPRWLATIWAQVSYIKDCALHLNYVGEKSFEICLLMASDQKFKTQQLA